jgi:hypothetical protein
MDFTSFTDIPEEFIKDFELGYVYKLIVELFCVLGREKLSELYQISLNGDISVDTLRALDEEKGQELAEQILGFKEFENLFKQKCLEKCKVMLFHSRDETDKLLLTVLKARELKEELLGLN